MSNVISFNDAKSPPTTKFTAPTLPVCDARDGTEDTRPLSELGNAQRLADAHADTLRYAYDARAWLYWDNSAWHWDVDGSHVRALAAALQQQVYNEGLTHLTDVIHFAKWSRMSQKEATINAATSLLRDFKQLRLASSVIDANPFQIGIDNAKQLVDLKTGIARPARQDD